MRARGDTRARVVRIEWVHGGVVVGGEVLGFVKLPAIHGGKYAVDDWTYKSQPNGRCYGSSPWYNVVGADKK